MNYFISDLHLGHENILTFTDNDDNLIRAFEDLSHMHGVIIDRWNSVVNKSDTVYVLGDVAWNEDSLHLMHAMKGNKILIKGNHDNSMNVRKYLDVFSDVLACKNLSFREIEGATRAVATHIPINPNCLGRWGINIHGHTHQNNVPDSPGVRYINTSCEQIDYTPRTLEELITDY